MSADVSEARESAVSRDQSNTFTWETNQRWKYERSKLQGQGDNPSESVRKKRDAKPRLQEATNTGASTQNCFVDRSETQVRHFRVAGQ